MNLKSIITITAIALVALSTSNAKAQIPPHSLTEKQLSDLRIHSSRSIQLSPGDTTLLKVKAWTKSYPPFLEDVAANAEWFITPNNGINLDRHTGELIVYKTAKPGAEFVITSVLQIGNQSREIQNTLHIYTQTSNPFVGTWADTRNEINELVFRADGTYSVTALPFESYRDYWGVYYFDTEEKIIQFEVTGGNNIPRDKELKGFYRFTNNDVLVLDDIYFGTIIENFKHRNRYTFRIN